WQRRRLRLVGGPFGRRNFGDVQGGGVGGGVGLSLGGLRLGGVRVRLGQGGGLGGRLRVRRCQRRRRPAGFSRPQRGLIFGLRFGLVVVHGVVIFPEDKAHQPLPEGPARQ